MMLSEKWEDRFQAEYWQARIRYEKLEEMLEKLEEDPDSVSKASKALFKDQMRVMYDYLSCLEDRALLEGIPL